MSVPATAVQQPVDASRAAAAQVARPVTEVIPEPDPNAPPEPLPLAINPAPYHGHPGLHWIDIRNFSRDPLAFSVRVSNDVTGKSLQRDLTLSSNTAADLGKDDGWEIEAGDTLTVSSPRFVDRVLTIS
jgi:hypothetical protein